MVNSKNKVVHFTRISKSTIVSLKSPSLICSLVRKFAKNNMEQIKAHNMKKNILLLALTFGALNASAQLTVFNNGHANVGSAQQSSNAVLSVGEANYRDTTYHVSFAAHNPATGCYNIGGEGIAYNSTAKSSGRSFGLRGVAGNCTSGYNFGLLGALQGKQGGAAVFGTTNGKIFGSGYRRPLRRLL